MLIYLFVVRRSAHSTPCEQRSRRAGRLAPRDGVVLAFMYLPLSIVIVYAFNKSGTRRGRRPASRSNGSLTPLENTGLQQAFLTSVVCALAATVIALVLGLLASLAVAATNCSGAKHLVRDHPPDRVARHRHGDGPIDDVRPLGVPLGFFTIDRRPRHVLHRARLQQRDRPAASDVASLRGSVRGPRRATFQTFRYVTFPAIRTALLAGALLAFALSFDEVIVTIFVAGGVKTLPIWIFQSFRLANQVRSSTWPASSRSCCR